VDVTELIATSVGLGLLKQMSNQNTSYFQNMIFIFLSIIDTGLGLVALDAGDLVRFLSLFGTGGLWSMHSLHLLMHSLFFQTNRIYSLAAEISYALPRQNPPFGIPIFHALPASPSHLPFSIQSSSRYCLIFLSFQIPNTLHSCVKLS
jgi:hypothetical protein